MSRRERWVWTSVFAAMLALSLGLLADQLRVGAELSAVDRGLVDRLLRRGARADIDTSAVAVVLVDDSSLTDLGLRWPLPRTVWADFVEVMSSYKPAALALSAWFEVPESSPAEAALTEALERWRAAGLVSDGAGRQLAGDVERVATAIDGDGQLSQAIAAAGNVVLGVACLPVRPALEPPSPVGLISYPAGNRDKLGLECLEMSGNFPAIGIAAAGQGMLNLLHDSDGRGRRYPYVASWKKAWVPSLALEAVRVGRPGSHAAALSRVSARDGGAPILRALPPTAFTRLRFADVLLSRPGTPVLTRALSSRIVIVGVSAQGTEDYQVGALGRPLPGTLVHANAVVDLLGQRDLTTRGKPAVLGLLAGALLLLVIYAGGLRMRRLVVKLAVAAAGGALWLGLALWRMPHGEVLAVMPVWLGIVGWVALHLALTGWQLNRSRNAYRAAKQRMESELAVGREIQESLLPPVSAVKEARPELDAHAVVRPAREVGGDFYDIFALDDGRVCLCIGDVSDKGVPAGLFMAVTMTLIESLARLDSCPASVARRVNDELSRNNDGAMFVTVFLAVLDTEAGTLTYTCAGHNPPYLRQGDGWVPLAQRHGPVVGAMAGLDYGKSEIAMAPGELLVAYTDGVTEAMNPAGALYGEARLAEVLDRVSESESAAAVVEAILAHVAGFESGAAQADDVTVVALRYSATANPS